MGKAIPRQQPAVVLRSHFNQLRALLAIALVVGVGLTVALVILANDSDEVSSTSSAAKPIESIRYGGFNSATGRPESAPLPQREASLQNRIDGTRSDGGPEEGTRGIAQPSAPSTFDPNSIKEAPGVRHDGGPEEGTRGIVPALPPSTRSDGGPEEGTRGPALKDQSTNSGSEYGTSQYRFAQP